MRDLLFPTTDAGVFVQVAVLVVAVSIGLWGTRRRPDARLLVVGAGLLLFALVGLRAAH